MVFEQQQEIEVICSLSFSDLQRIEPCPFDQGYGLVALLASEKLLIVYFLQSESNYAIISIDEISLESPCTCLSWCPATFIKEEDGETETYLSLVYGTAAGNIAVIETNSALFSIDAHSRDINDVSVSHQPLNRVSKSETIMNHLIASVAEDCSLRIFSLGSEKEVSRILLSSPGMKVQWHDQLSQRLLVSEARGCVHVVDWKSQSYLQSLHASVPGVLLSNSSPDFFGNEILLDCDWHFSDPTRIGAVIGNNWFYWDLQGKSDQNTINRPYRTGGLEGHRGKFFRWGKRQFAIANSNKTVFLYNVAYTQIARALRFGKDIVGISWLNDTVDEFHYSEPFLLVAHKDGIKIYKI